MPRLFLRRLYLTNFLKQCSGAIRNRLDLEFWKLSITVWFRDAPEKASAIDVSSHSDLSDFVELHVRSSCIFKIPGVPLTDDEKQQARQNHRHIKRFYRGRRLRCSFGLDILPMFAMTDSKSIAPDNIQLPALKNIHLCKLFSCQQRYQQSYVCHVTLECIPEKVRPRKTSSELFLHFVMSVEHC